MVRVMRDPHGYTLLDCSRTSQTTGSRQKSFAAPGVSLVHCSGYSTSALSGVRPASVLNSYYVL